MPDVRVRAATRLAAPVAVSGIAATLVLLAWTTIAPESAEGAAFVPLLVGMVFLGLPHGALDHLVPARMGAAWGRRPASWALFLAGYVGLAAVALRGAPPVAVPVLVQTEVGEGLFATAAVATGAVVGGGLNLGAPAVGWGLGIALLAFAGVYLAGLGNAWRGWPGRAVDVGELLLLVALFAWVPAYLALGTYFLAWHSLRHLARLLLLRQADAGAIARGDLRGPVLRLARDLVPTTLLALALLVALTAWSGPRVDGLEEFVALYLVWISALTMPHLALVAWMDVGAAQRQRPVVEHPDSVRAGDSVPAAI